MSARSHVALIILALLVVAPRLARGEPGQMAREHFEAGKRLMVAGKLESACAAFAESHRLEPDDSTLLSLADCRERNGELATAYRLFTEVARAAGVSSFRRLGARRALALEPRLSTLTLAIGEPVPEGVVVYLDESQIAWSPVSDPIAIDGGTHSVRVVAPGYRALTTMLTVASEREAARLSLVALARAEAPLSPVGVAASAEPVAPSTSRRVDAPRRWTSRRRYVALGVGGAALTFAGTSGLLWRHANTLADSSEATCPKSGCSPKKRRDAEELYRRGERYAVATNVGLGLAATAAVAATWLWWTGSPESPARVSIEPRAGGAAVSLTGTF